MRESSGSGRGHLIVNADDWGSEPRTTNLARDCVAAGAVNAVSAMVFMEDSERAAGIACEHGLDVGLHLNFTTPFSGPVVADALTGHQRRVAGHLLRHRLAQTVFHPGLIGSFEYLVAAQIEEFARVYGFAPERFDGHHHMHLSANVLWARLLPQGARVRRSFSFRAGERSAINRLYRRAVDRQLARRHVLTEFLFNLQPLEPAHRLADIVRLALRSVVEVETHPVLPDEYRFLLSGQLVPRPPGEQISPPRDRHCGATA